MSNCLNDFFDKIYCINLDRRADRWAEASAEFDKFNLTVERVSAVDGSALNLSDIKMEVLKKESMAAACGCSLSHIKAIQDAKQKGYSKILILEDDVVFRENLIQRFEQDIKDLPDDWDMFYLSGNNLSQDSLTKVKNNIWRTNFTYTTHCYAINYKIYDIIIDGAGKLNEPIDEFYKSVIQKQYNCYISRPHLSWQREGYSDIMKGMRYYKNIKED